VVLRDETDALVWCYNSTGVYSSQSMYAIINYRGVTPVYVPAVWKINVPLKLQIFCLLSHNKLAIADNLNKKECQNLFGVSFVVKMKVLCTYFLSVMLQRLYGTILVIFWEWRLDLIISLLFLNGLVKKYPILLISSHLQ
jgi:hypothetical protein